MKLEDLIKTKTFAPTILVKNSYSKLMGFSNEAVALVKDALTYRNMEVLFERQRLQILQAKARVSRNKKWFLSAKKRLESLPPEIVCLLDENGNVFPTGLINLVKETLKDKSYQVLDKRHRPEPYHTFRWNNEPTYRYYQQEMIERGVAKGRGVISASVASGKTLVAVGLTKELGVNTLFVVPSIALLEQTYNEYAKFLGSKHVCKVNTRSTKKLKPIRIVTIQTLYSLFKKKEVHNVLSDVDCVIIDEAHHQASMSYVTLLSAMSHVYYRFSLTGTFLRGDSKTLDLWSITSDILYDYPPKKATEDGYVAPVKYIIKNLSGRAARYYPLEYDRNYCGSKVLLQFVGDILQEIPQDKQVLILVEQKTKAGEVISGHLKSLGIEHTYITGDNSKKEINTVLQDYNDRKIKVLISTRILGEGVDVKSIEYLLFLQGGKSVTKFVQAVGRAVRPCEGKTYAHVYDVNFTGTRFLHRHTQTRTRTFNQWFAGEVKNI